MHFLMIRKFHGQAKLVDWQLPHLGRLTNGETVPSPVREPLTLEISELFQIHGGKPDQIEAVLNRFLTE